MSRVFYKWSTLRRVLKYSRPIISIFESLKIKKYATKEPEYQPVFIIGSPRSGSTILYQLITNYLDVLYVDNLINLSRGNLFFGFWQADPIAASVIAAYLIFEGIKTLRE